MIESDIGSVVILGGYYYNKGCFNVVYFASGGHWATDFVLFVGSETKERLFSILCAVRARAFTHPNHSHVCVKIIKVVGK